MRALPDPKSRRSNRPIDARFPVHQCLRVKNIAMVSNMVVIMASLFDFGEIAPNRATRFVLVRLLTYMVGALVLALLLSTQFLAQMFVWEYFSSDEILAGWALIFRDRLIVAGGIALALTAIEVSLSREDEIGIWPAFLAILLGAVVSEIGLQWLDPQSDRSGFAALAGRILRWAIVAGAACSIFALWQRIESSAALGHVAELRKLRADRLLTRLRLRALQRQIEPHFLFNTLATIRRLQRSSPQQGHVLLANFLDFLRGTLSPHDLTTTSLKEELAVATAYLQICSIRMGGLLTWTIDAPPELHSFAFPRFGLATLLENAVKHGIAPSPRGGTIQIAARKESDMLVVLVTDTGAGFSSDHGTGLGLSNIREQMFLQFGPDAALTLTSNRPSGVCATIRLPVIPS